MLDISVSFSVTINLGRENNVPLHSKAEKASKLEKKKL